MEPPAYEPLPLEVQEALLRGKGRSTCAGSRRPAPTTTRITISGVTAPPYIFHGRHSSPILSMAVKVSAMRKMMMEIAAPLKKSKEPHMIPAVNLT